MLSSRNRPRFSSQGDKDWLTVLQNVYQSFIGTVRAQQSLPDVKQRQRQEKTLGNYEGNNR